MDNLSQRLESIEQRLQNIEQIIEGKLDPLLELLQLVIKTNLTKDKTTIEPVPPPVDLMYSEHSDTVYITGTKTYNNREIIKATFKGASWDKEKSAWSFKRFDDYEKTLLNVFPNILKDQ
tara:strand:- start:1383 stop:1742 length:360 start_codon:yes stop_codon:yes gene_type:complete